MLPVGRVKIARARASRARGGIQWGSLYRERHRKHALHTLPHAGCSSRTARPAARMFASCISEYFRDKRTPWAPPWNAARTA